MLPSLRCIFEESEQPSMNFPVFTVRKCILSNEINEQKYHSHSRNLEQKEIRQQKMAENFQSVSVETIDLLI